jgi:hypothetical protein
MFFFPLLSGIQDLLEQLPPTQFSSFLMEFFADAGYNRVQYLLHSEKIKEIHRLANDPQKAQDFQMLCEKYALKL